MTKDTSKQRNAAARQLGASGAKQTQGVGKLWLPTRRRSLELPPLFVRTKLTFSEGAATLISNRSFDIFRIDPKAENSSQKLELLGSKEVRRLLRCSRTSLHRYRKLPGFPKQVLRRFWIRSEVERWVRGQRSEK
jgi:hypothetical protein